MFEFLVKKNAYTDNTGTAYTIKWCEEYREQCLQNYDKNIKYFSLLDRTDFNNAVSVFLKKHKGFCKVDCLIDFDATSGYYLMILDEYKQVYIGKSDNIKKRIQQHWSHNTSFDRTLFPMYAKDTSCFSIDCFRALDTTRIFAWKRSLVEGIEKNLIADFPKQYCTNRIGGDISTGMEALLTINKRVLK